jgi:elongation factor Ts
MHIAFSNPMGITVDDIPADLVAKEKEIAKQQAIESGKPEEIAEKMVTGKIKKFLAANALLEQPFVKDDKKTVKEILGGQTITAFARYAVGEAD